jgi:hypothetical protein
MGAIGGGGGSSVGGEEDSPWRATISTSESPHANGSIEVPASRAASEEIGLKGVTIDCKPFFVGSDKVDLSRLRRRCTKATIAITHIALPPPMIPPAIAGVLDLCDDDLVFVTTPLAVMLNTGALREGPCQA